MVLPDLHVMNMVFRTCLGELKKRAGLCNLCVSSFNKAYSCADVNHSGPLSKYALKSCHPKT